MKYEIEPSVMLETHQHRGKWVALTRKKLVAVGDSSTEVYNLAQKAGVKVPIIYRVPEAGYLHFYMAAA